MHTLSSPSGSLPKTQRNQTLKVKGKISIREYGSVEWGREPKNWAYGARGAITRTKQRQATIAPADGFQNIRVQRDLEVLGKLRRPFKNDLLAIIGAACSFGPLTFCPPFLTLGSPGYLSKRLASTEGQCSSLKSPQSKWLNRLGWIRQITTQTFLQAQFSLDTQIPFCAPQPSDWIALLEYLWACRVRGTVQSQMFL